MQDPAREAQALYQRHIVETGYTPPDTYADLLLFVEFSGAPALVCGGAPRGFAGIQIGDWVYVNGDEQRTDRERMRILAHEWCHWLRRHKTFPRRARLYDGVDGEDVRDSEEEIARAFQKLF